MCCVRPNDEELLARQQTWRQQKAVDDLAAAIESAELPEIKGVKIEGAKNGGVSGLRNTRTNG